MAEQVEGEWKNFVFRMAKPSDRAAILEHCRKYFYRDEPMCSYTGFEDTMGDDFDGYVSACLQENLSFIAVDKSTDIIAGVRVTAIARKDEHEDPPTFKNEKSRIIFGVIVKLSEDASVFQKYPNIDHYADFVLVSVAREYRGCGLASEIYERAFKMLTALKFPLIKCVFSSPYTQKIARKREFKQLCSIRFRDWKNEQGETYFPMAKEDECAILMVKEL